MLRADAGSRLTRRRRRSIQAKNRLLCVGHKTNLAKHIGFAAVSRHAGEDPLYTMLAAVLHHASQQACPDFFRPRPFAGQGGGKRQHVAFRAISALEHLSKTAQRPLRTLFVQHIRGNPNAAPGKWRHHGNRQRTARTRQRVHHVEAFGVGR